MAEKKAGWTIWLDRLITVAAIVMVAWVLGKYLLPTSGERVGGEAVEFIPRGRPALVEFSMTT